MKHAPLLAPLAVLLAATSAAQSVDLPTSVARTQAEVDIVGNTPYVEGQLIVRFRAPITVDEAGAALNPSRYAVEKLCPPLDMFLVHVSDGLPVIDAIGELSDHPLVDYAVPDHVVTRRATTPNDSSFTTLWNFNNTGQSGGTPDADIDAPEAWDLGTGSQAYVVSVVDGGCTITHPDLSPNIYQNTAEIFGSPGVDDDGNGYVDDKNGWDAYGQDGTIPGDQHGSHVNGIVGAKGNNGLGVTGVNWNVTLMPVAGSSGTTSIVVRAYTYAYDQKSLWLSSGGTQGANVVATNSSFGVDFANCTSGTYAPWNQTYDLMGTVGILSAAATMNNNSNVDITGDVPTGCGSDFMIAVTNTTRNDVKNTGAAFGLNTIDLGAPGTSIFSTSTGAGYALLTGTSMASPHVAGAVAFLHSVSSPTFQAFYASDPANGAREIKNQMIATVDPLTSLAGKTVSGGRLNLNSAALAMVNWGGGGPTCPYTSYGTGLGAPNFATIASASSAEVGQAQTIDLSGFNGSGTALLLLCRLQASVPFRGGTMLVDNSTRILTWNVGITAGSGSQAFNLPNNPGLIGRSYNLQAVMADGTQPGGWAFTHGLTATICQ